MLTVECFFKIMAHDLPKAYEPGAIETRWAEYWIKEKLFSVATPPSGETRPVFTMLLPPPNVTGRLHMGHMLNQTQMDIIVRWHRMRGFITLWLPGTDHAGIATQMMVERQLAKEGKKRRDLGREKFIERVWEWKKLYGGAILDQMKRLGASVDWAREYFTMDENLSRAVREVFDRLKDEGYTHLHGKRVLLPLMNREIPIITDELAQPEFGTGAVKVTPAHDPNDFEAGLRHNLPQIEVIDEHSKMNANAGPYAGLDRFAARARIVEDLSAQGFLVGTKDYTIALGKCDRSGTIVEPRLSTQWFVKIAPLAKRAIEVVEKGYIRFTPENYGQIYLNWMHNIHDWCISRQLWWGHRIPAWHCSCGEIMVAREAPGKCTKCGVSELRQDTDVLDTWFSSGLLPFTTLGWPEKTRDLEVFYPTTLLITAYEILFFWVARMIMFGCHFMQGHQQDPAIKKASGWADKKNDTVPFRQVYIHALVRDADRQKMSKTKGNVIDPLEIIERFGTDATRFTLAAMAAPGTDIAFSESRTDGYRAFANKIWNAARFMFMNVDRLEFVWRQPHSAVRPGQGPGGAGTGAGVAGFHPATLEDRWILSRFNRVAAEVNDALRSYRFHEAANRIYDFFWGEFCDWYLELIKPRLNIEEGADKTEARIACANLVNLFDSSLRLLHPVMPFITEEIWQAMYEGQPPLKSIALAPYPQPDERQFDLTTETEMAILQDLIVSIRNVRADLKVEPKVKVPIEIFAHEPKIRAMIEKNLSAILSDRSSHVEKVTFVDGSLAKQTAVRSTARFYVHIVYERKIDIAAERERLNKDLEKSEKEFANNQRQLSNEQFLSKAPEKVIEGLRTRAKELVALIDKVKKQLDGLNGTGPHRENG